MSQEEPGGRLRSAAAQLYGGPLAEFISARTTLVKAARAEKDKDAVAEIGALRKPSVAAWAVNQVVREQPDVVQRLRDLGARMRHAQSTLDAAGMAGLRGERDAVLAALVAASAQVSAASGSSLTAAVESEVRDTGIAALADLGAEEVAWSGALTRALHYSGFGEVDIADAVALTSTGVILARLPGGGQGEPSRRSRGRAADKPAKQEPVEEPTEEPTEEPSEQPSEQSVEDQVAEEEEPPPATEDLAAQAAEADRTVAELEREVAARLAEIDQARRRVEATGKRLDKLRADLATTEQENTSARAALDKATQARKKAMRALADAEDEATALHDRLDG